MKNLENGDSRMANPVMWENENWPKKAQGVGLTEAPRGALAHFIVMENNRVKNYQMVVPTTWMLRRETRTEIYPLTSRP